MNAVAAVLLIVEATGSAFVEEPTVETPKQATVRAAAERVGAATLKGDYATVVDLTWDGAVLKMGGREKAIRNMEAGMKRIADKGWTIKSYKVRSAGAVHTEGECAFCLAPTTLEVATTDSRIISKNYLLGISKDGGATWKFVDSAAIQDEKSRDAILPPLPSGFILPKRERPEVIKEKQAVRESFGGCGRPAFTSCSIPAWRLGAFGAAPALAWDTKA